MWTFDYSLYDRFADNNPRRGTDTWERFVGTIMSPVRQPATMTKQDVPCWSPALYDAGAKRANGNVKAISMFALDYDDVDDNVLRQVLEVAKHQTHSLVHSTWSHKRGDHNYFRLLVPFAKPLRIADCRAWPAWHQLLASRIHAPKGYDAKCNDASRLYALPVTRPAEPMPLWYAQGLG